MVLRTALDASWPVAFASAGAAEERHRLEAFALQQGVRAAELHQARRAEPGLREHLDPSVAFEVEHGPVGDLARELPREVAELGIAQHWLASAHENDQCPPRRLGIACQTRRASTRPSTAIGTIAMGHAIQLPTVFAASPSGRIAP